MRSKDTCSRMIKSRDGSMIDGEDGEKARENRNIHGKQEIINCRVTPDVNTRFHAYSAHQLRNKTLI